jgi:hypothetical protein
VGREKLRACCYRIFSARFVIFWKAGAGRHVDLEVGGFVAVDGGEGAEEHAGNVGESGSAARGDASAGEEFVEGGEGVVDALGVLKVTGVFGEFRGEVFGVGQLKTRAELTRASGPCGCYSNIVTSKARLFFSCTGVIWLATRR